MHEKLERPMRVLAGCALMVLASCGSGAAPSSTEAALSSSAAGPRVTPQNSGTTNGLIAISAVNARVVWVSGRAGTYAVTTDGGATWRPGVVPGAEALQFRDVEAVSDKIAYLLSIGNGTDSRIYKTTDGGKTWTMEFQNQIPDAFYDCFAFWDATSGIAFSDSVNGRFPVLRTLDGTTWQDIGDALPPALPGEAGFAASGTCTATQGHRRAWITTGGATPAARVLYTTDRGQTWSAASTPLRGSPSAGGFSIAFRDARHGIVGGGDLDPTAPPFDNFARSRDGGRTWELGANAPIGTIFGLSYAGHGNGGDDDEGQEGPSIRVVATGPGGTAWSPDEGRTWNAIPGLTGFWAVGFGSQQTGWVVGTGGRIDRIDF